jgi:hypothetical protein
MAYPKLKQLITLKKVQLVHAARSKRRMELSQVIHGRRINHTTLHAGKLGYEDMVEIFTLCSCSLDDALSINLLEDTFRSFTPPSRDELLSMSNALNDEFAVVNAAMMYDIFPDWGESQLDKWATECNNRYTFIFSLYYNAGSMTTQQTIKVYGKPNIDLPTYVDKYNQAQTMYKLESNL